MSPSKFQLERVSEAPVSDQEILSDIRLAAQAARTDVLSVRLYSEHGSMTRQLHRDDSAHEIRR